MKQSAPVAVEEPLPSPEPAADIIEVPPKPETEDY